MTLSAPKTEDEIWLDIPGYKAQASSLGRIKSFYQSDKGRIRKLQKGLKGKYLRVQFINRGPYESVHRLVALAWCDNPNCFNIVNHIDRDGTNNRPSNLEWCNQSHNVNHSNRINKNRKQKKIFSWYERIMIKDAIKAGFSKLAISKYFNVTDTTIRRVALYE